MAHCLGEVMAHRRDVGMVTQKDDSMDGLMGAMKGYLKVLVMEAKRD